MNWFSIWNWFVFIWVYVTSSICTIFNQFWKLPKTSSVFKFKERKFIPTNIWTFSLQRHCRFASSSVEKVDIVEQHLFIMKMTLIFIQLVIYIVHCISWTLLIQLWWSDIIYLTPFLLQYFLLKGAVLLFYRFLNLFWTSLWLFCFILGNLFQNQFFISGLSGDEMIRNRVLEALYRRIMRAYNDKKSFRVIIVIPLLPGFQVILILFSFSFSTQ